MNQINQWSRNDDNRIVDLLLEGNNFIDISFIVNETPSFIKKRLVLLGKDSIKNGTSTVNDMSIILGVNPKLLK